MTQSNQGVLPNRTSTVEVRPAVQKQVLAAAQRLCETREKFTPVEIVRALPHLNEKTVRTHVVSRCCVDAPNNHQHRWPYFHRVSRGVYQIASEFRRSSAAGEVSPERPPTTPVADAAPTEGDHIETRDTVHAVVTKSDGWYVAECLELAVVTQGQSFDELLVSLREALELHMTGEDLAQLGLSSAPRLIVSYEAPPLTR